jgi:3-hydroxyacyl-[acyl-carrier-protein] dehydratase
MVLKDFYKVLHRSGPEEDALRTGIPEESYRFALELNSAHPVYEGHFSGNPVVPGVCQVQMISEMVSAIRGTTFRLIKADTIKFLALMVPDKNRFIDAQLRIRLAGNGELSVNATLHEGETVFIKFKGVFRVG